MDIKTDSNHTVMRSRPLIFLDLEATGLQIQRHEIIEIGALKVKAKKPFPVVEQLEVRIKPSNMKVADRGALKLVGYSDERWEDAISLAEALKRLDDFAEDGVLVGYNVSFDWAMLDRAYYNLGRSDPFYYHRLDVMPIAYQKLFSEKEVKRFSLGEICKYFKITRENKHQALDDAKATYLVFKKLFS